MMTPVRGTVRTSDADLAYESWAFSDGSPLVLVHGGAHNLRIWDSLIPRLRAHGPVIAYDLRGHGASSGNGDQRMSTHAADLGRLVEGLRSTNPIIISHSFGVGVALTYASAGGGCRGLVALDGLVTAMGRTYHIGPSEIASSLDENPRFSGDQKLADRWLDASVLSEAEDERPVWRGLAARSLARDNERLIERPPRDEVVALIEEQFAWTPEDLWRDLGVPALLLLARTGEEPPAGPDEDLRKDVVSELRRDQRHLAVSWIDSDHNLPVCKPRCRPTSPPG